MGDQKGCRRNWQQACLEDPGWRKIKADPGHISGTTKPHTVAEPSIPTANRYPSRK